MFPNNAITKTFSASGTMSGTIEPLYPSVIYSVRMQQQRDMSETGIFCNGSAIAYNWAKDYTLDLMRYRCNGAITYTKTGNDIAFISITYSTSTNDFQGINAGFTYGEIVNSVFLFTIAFFLVYAFYWFTIHRPQKP